MSHSYLNRRRSSGRLSRPRRARGVAMLVAIMLVALATIIAASIGYDSAMAAKRATGTIAFDQSVLIAQGAEGLAAFALKQVFQNAGNGARTTNPTQAWAQPVGPLEITPGVNLDAQMEDLTGRFNVNSLVGMDSTGRAVADPEAQKAFETLLTELQIENPQHWTALLIDWIDGDTQPTQDGGEDSFYLSQLPAYVPPNTYITSITELLALPGFGEANYQRLAPFITALPLDAKINVCTASAEVLNAFLGNSGRYNDPELNKSREAANGCWPQMNDFQAAYQQANPTAATANGTGGPGAPAPGMAQGIGPQGGAGVNQNGIPLPGTNQAGVGMPGTTVAGAGVTTATGFSGHFAVTSSYFRLTSHITTDNGTEFNVYSLMYQDASQGTARPILRSFTPD